MGPRPRGRGNRALDAKEFRIPALQWGRARAGAEIWLTAAVMVVTACFNGAAPARARKLDGLAGRFRPRRSFNGAAPARARKSRPSGRYKTRLGQLQWGRARAGAEIALSLLLLAQARNPAI